MRFCLRRRLSEMVRIVVLANLFLLLSFFFFSRCICSYVNTSCSLLFIFFLSSFFLSSSLCSSMLFFFYSHDGYDCSVIPSPTFYPCSLTYISSCYFSQGSTLPQGHDIITVVYIPYSFFFLLPMLVGYLFFSFHFIILFLFHYKALLPLTFSSLIFI